MDITLSRSGEDARRTSAAQALQPFTQGCNLKFPPACTNLYTLTHGGALVSASPTERDYPILLQGSKCSHGSPFVLKRLCAPETDAGAESPAVKIKNISGDAGTLAAREKLAALSFRLSILPSSETKEPPLPKYRKLLRKKARNYPAASSFARCVARITALISVTRRPPSSSSRMPSTVQPAGVVTASLSSAG